MLEKNHSLFNYNPKQNLVFSDGRVTSFAPLDLSKLNYNMHLMKHTLVPDSDPEPTTNSSPTTTKYHVEYIFKVVVSNGMSFHVVDRYSSLRAFYTALKLSCSKDCN